jgi:hypothetical protein
LHWLFNAPLRDLWWPHNLSSNNVTIEKQVAEGDALSSILGKTPDPLKCANPTCPTRHNHAVSQVTGDLGNRRVLWYCTMKCRNMHLAGA